MQWFGYKLHLLVDTTYELPLAWTLTKASVYDSTQAVPLIVQHVFRAEYLVMSSFF